MGGGVGVFLCVEAGRPLGDAWCVRGAVCVFWGWRVSKKA